MQKTAKVHFCLDIGSQVAKTIDDERQRHLTLEVEALAGFAALAQSVPFCIILSPFAVFHPQSSSLAS